MEASKGAIEAAIKAYYGDCPTGDKETDFWADMLKAAYAIDFEALQQENARLKAEVGKYYKHIFVVQDERDRLAEQLAMARSDYEMRCRQLWQVGREWQDTKDKLAEAQREVEELEAKLEADYLAGRTEAP